VSILNQADRDYVEATVTAQNGDKDCGKSLSGLG